MLLVSGGDDVCDDRRVDERLPGLVVGPLKVRESVVGERREEEGAIWLIKLKKNRESQAYDDGNFFFSYRDENRQ